MNFPSQCMAINACGQYQQPAGMGFAATNPFPSANSLTPLAPLPMPMRAARPTESLSLSAEAMQALGEEGGH